MPMRKLETFFFEQKFYAGQGYFINVMIIIETFLIFCPENFHFQTSYSRQQQPTGSCLLLRNKKLMPHLAN